MVAIYDLASRAMGHLTEIRMQENEVQIDGSRIVYSVSSNINDVATDQKPLQSIWAINIHGYFAGGAVYWRESARLAHNLGLKVVNPSLPGFGGSDPIAWRDLSMDAMAKKVLGLMDFLEIERALLFGHSMGGCVAIKIATLAPSRVLGIVYRDGAATPSWRQRNGLVAKALYPVGPDLAMLLDLAVGAFLDVPDLVAGRVASTIKAVLPDLGKNVRYIGNTIPVGALLFGTNLTKEVKMIAQNGDIPILAEWGSLDQITPPYTAKEFSEVSGQPILWVPGGHSWMLARPATQSWVLKYHPRGKEFCQKVIERNRQLRTATARLKIVR